MAVLKDLEAVLDWRMALDSMLLYSDWWSLWFPMLSQEVAVVWSG
jgi:hypothetical protein